jgi:hypothetical protein
MSKTTVSEAVKTTIDSILDAAIKEIIMHVQTKGEQYNFDYQDDRGESMLQYRADKGMCFREMDANDGPQLFGGNEIYIEGIFVEDGQLSYVTNSDGWIEHTPVRTDHLTHHDIILILECAEAYEKPSAFEQIIEREA